MAGFYADVPAPKMATDKDGTQWFWHAPSNAITSVSSTDITKMTGIGFNPYGAPEIPGAGGRIALVFPEKRDIAGLFMASHNLNDYSRTVDGRWETSPDTTNGLDGTWTTAVASFNHPTQASPHYRTGIKIVNVSGVKGVRWVHTSVNWGAQIQACHVYGWVAAGQNQDRLAMWHPTLDQECTGAFFDWGDVPRNSTAIKQFRVKNRSATKTAQTARCAMSVITDATPGLLSTTGLSLDGITYASQIQLGDIAPGALTGILHVRRQTPANAQGGPWHARIFSEATAWV